MQNSHIRGWPLASTHTCPHQYMHVHTDTKIVRALGWVKWASWGCNDCGLSCVQEIQQQIFQQKHCMTVLENQIGCLTPELSELKRQYASVSDLFNTKKSALQDHFATFLNGECGVSWAFFLAILKYKYANSTVDPKADVNLASRQLAQTIFKRIINIAVNLLGKLLMPGISNIPSSLKSVVHGRWGCVVSVSEGVPVSMLPCQCLWISCVLRKVFVQKYTIWPSVLNWSSALSFRTWLGCAHCWGKQVSCLSCIWIPVWIHGTFFLFFYRAV